MKMRAPTMGDAGEVIAVIRARDVADLGVPDFTLEDLLEEWRLPGFDLRADARVVEMEGQIVAYAVVRRPGSMVSIDPEFENRGIGTQLLQWTEARELEKRRPLHRQWVPSRAERAAALLRRAGYKPVRSYWRMALTLD